MRFLTDEEIKDVRAEAKYAYDNITDTDLWKTINWSERSLSDLVILQASYQALMEEFDRRIAIVVSQGRAAGASWAEVGKILGISKQAAQQRFGS